MKLFTNFTYWACFFDFWTNVLLTLTTVGHDFKLRARHEQHRLMQCVGAFFHLNDSQGTWHLIISFLPPSVLPFVFITRSKLTSALSHRGKEGAECGVGTKEDVRSFRELRKPCCCCSRLRPQLGGWTANACLSQGSVTTLIIMHEHHHYCSPTHRCWILAHKHTVSVTIMWWQLIYLLFYKCLCLYVCAPPSLFIYVCNRKNV